MKLVEKLLPQIFKKVGYSFKVIPPLTPTEYDFNALAKEALWIAINENVKEKDIIRAACSLIVKWLREDIEPQLAEKIRVQRSKRPTHPVDDPFSLPWGERIAEATIKSGEKGPLAVAIEPVATDKELLTEDAAKYLFKILSYITEWWGPHALVWFVLLNDNKLRPTMRKLGSTDLTLVKQVMRSVAKIKTDIQENFETTRI